MSRSVLARFTWSTPLPEGARFHKSRPWLLSCHFTLAQRSHLLLDVIVIRCPTAHLIWPKGAEYVPVAFYPFIFFHVGAAVYVFHLTGRVRLACSRPATVTSDGISPPHSTNSSHPHQFVFDKIQGCCLSTSRASSPSSPYSPSNTHGDSSSRAIATVSAEPPPSITPSTSTHPTRRRLGLAVEPRQRRQREAAGHKLEPEQHDRGGDDDVLGLHYLRLAVAAGDLHARGHIRQAETVP